MSLSTPAGSPEGLPFLDRCITMQVAIEVSGTMMLTYQQSCRLHRVPLVCQKYTLYAHKRMTITLL